MLVALFFIVLAAVTWLYIIPSQVRINAMWGGSSGVNGRTFPYFATALVALAALGELIQSAIEYISLRRQGKTAEKIAIEWKKELRAVIIFVLCLVYAIIFSTLGYVIATIIVPPIMLFVMGNRNWVHYISIYALGGIMYALFVYLLRIPLP